MKYLAVFKFKFTYDYYKPVINGSTVDYVFDHTGNGLVVPSGVGGMTLVTTNQLTSGGSVNSVKDAKGNELLIADGATYPMYVHSASPELSEQVLVGWRHSLRAEQPRDFMALLQQLANS